MRYANGETITTFDMEADKLYRLGVDSTDENTLGLFSLALSSSHPVAVEGGQLEAVPPLFPHPRICLPLEPQSQLRISNVRHSLSCSQASSSSQSSSPTLLESSFWSKQLASYEAGSHSRDVSLSESERDPCFPEWGSSYSSSPFFDTAVTHIDRNIRLSKGTHHEPGFWRQHQQWLLELSDSTVVRFRIKPHSVAFPFKVGIYILRSEFDPPQKCVDIPESVRNETPFQADEVHSTRLKSGKYIIIPCASDAHQDFEALLSVSVENGSFNFGAVSAVLESKSLRGTWSEKNSGGRWLLPTWLKNSQYSLKLKRDTKCVILLSLDTPTSTPASFYVAKNLVKTFNSVMELNETTLVHSASFTSSLDSSFTLEGNAGDIFNIIPATFDPITETVAYSLSIHACDLSAIEFVPVSRTVFSLTAEWKSRMPGGSLDHVTWRNNLQACLKLPVGLKGQTIGIAVIQSRAADLATPMTKSNNFSSLSNTSPPQTRRVLASSSSSLASSSSFHSMSSTSSTQVHQHLRMMHEDLDGSIEDSNSGLAMIGFNVFPYMDTKRVLIDSSKDILNSSFCAPNCLAQVSTTFMLDPGVVGSVSPSVLASPDFLPLTIMPFHCDVYLPYNANYHIYVVIDAVVEVRQGLPSLTSVTLVPFEFSYTGIWLNPLEIPSNMSGAPNILRSSRQLVTISKRNTSLSLVLRPPTGGSGSISIYKLREGVVWPARTISRELRGADELSILLGKADLVTKSPTSSSDQIQFGCTLEIPGQYIICAVPETNVSGLVSLWVYHKNRIHLIRLVSTNEALQRTKDGPRILELVQTEVSYLNALHKLLDYYTLLNERLPANIPKPPLSAIDSIIIVHESFLEKLCSVIDIESVARAFLQHHRQLVLAFTSFISGYQSNLSLIAELRSSHPELDRLLSTQEFVSLYITPVQRSPRYELFLNAFKDSAVSIEDRNLVASALEKVEGITRSMNEALRLEEGFKRARELQNALFYKDNSPAKWADDPRYLLLEVSLISAEAYRLPDPQDKAERKQRKSALHYLKGVKTFHLLSDGFLLTTPRAQGQYYYCFHSRITAHTQASSAAEGITIEAVITPKASLKHYYVDILIKCEKQRDVEDLLKAIQNVIQTQIGAERSR